jgi:hypothetical protein
MINCCGISLSNVVIAFHPEQCLLLVRLLRLTRMALFPRVADGNLFGCAILGFSFKILRMDTRRLVLTHGFHLLSKFLTDPSPENGEGEGIDQN